jgi:hypothetical protein
MRQPPGTSSPGSCGRSRQAPSGRCSARHCVPANVQRVDERPRPLAPCASSHPSLTIKLSAGLTKSSSILNSRKEGADLRCACLLSFNAVFSAMSASLFYSNPCTKEVTRDHRRKSCNPVLGWLRDTLKNPSDTRREVLASGLLSKRLIGITKSVCQFSRQTDHSSACPSRGRHLCYGPLSDPFRIIGC